MVSKRTLFQSDDALISGVITKEQGAIVKSSIMGTEALSIQLLDLPLTHSSSPRITLLFQVHPMRLIPGIL